MRRRALHFFLFVLANACALPSQALAALTIERDIVAFTSFADFDARGGVDLKVKSVFSRAKARQDFHIKGPFALREEVVIQIKDKKKQFLCLSPKTSILFDETIDRDTCFPVRYKIEKTDMDGAAVDILAGPKKTAHESGLSCQSIELQLNIPETKVSSSTINAGNKQSVCVHQDVLDPFQTGYYLLIDTNFPVKTKKAMLGGLVLSTNVGIHMEVVEKGKAVKNQSPVFTINTVKHSKAKPPRGQFRIPKGYKLESKVLTLSAPVDTTLLAKLGQMATLNESAILQGDGTVNDIGKARGLTPPKTALGMSAKPRWVGLCPGQDVRQCPRAIRELAKCLEISVKKAKNAHVELTYVVSKKGHIDSADIKVLPKGFGVPAPVKACFETTLIEFLYEIPTDKKPKRINIRMTQP